MKLYKGDCLEVLRELPENSVDMVLCDLPYGVTDCEWDKVIPFEKLWKQYRRITKENAPIVLFSVQPFTTLLIHSNKREFRYCWYWKKNTATGAPFAKYQPMRCIEDICVFYRKTPKYNPQGLKELERPIRRESQGRGIYKTFKTSDGVQRFTNYPRNLLYFDSVGTKEEPRLHPTQKPAKLLEYLIQTYTDEGATVLDNCMGSGSTGEACKNTHRKFIGIELDEHYYNIACERLNA